MRKSRFTEEQKVKMLQEADRTSVAEKHGVSNETIYSWRRNFGGIPCPFGPRVAYAPGAVRPERTVDVPEAKRLKLKEKFEPAPVEPNNPDDPSDPADPDAPLPESGDA